LVNKTKSKSTNSPQYDPASYWHELIDLTKIESDETEKAKVKSEKDDEDEEEEEEAEEEKIDISTSNEIVDLSKAVGELNAKLKEDAFLLVNSINWEDNIIYDMNQTHISSSSNTNAGNVKIAVGQRNVLTTDNEVINERIKFAGWIPSNEHRTLVSFQSKILGKKVDYLNQFKEQLSSGAHLGGSSGPGKHASAAAAMPNSGFSWSSIFPNENYDLINESWEEKIIFDPKVFLISLYRFVLNERVKISFLRIELRYCFKF
jgi:hypothetical protein